MKPIDDYIQEDLSNYDVMVLDCFSKVYIWQGLKSNEIERKAAVKKVDEFIAGCADGRDVKNVDVVFVDPCGEPLAFRAAFPEWEEEVSQRWMELDPYEKQMAELEAQKAAYMQKFAAEEKKYDAPAGQTYPLEQLQKECPEGVNPAKK